MMYPRRNARNDGFTLIELLVAVAIATLLVGVIVGVIAHTKRKGQQTACLSNLRQLGQATLLYAQDYDGHLPPFRNQRDDRSTRDSSSGYPSPELLYGALMPYVGNRNIWYCPSDPLAGQDVDRWGINHLYSSYFFNGRRNLRLRADGFSTWYGYRVEPSDWKMIADPNTAYWPSVLAGPSPPRLTPTPGCEHFGGVNVFYLDGHAKWLRL
jgi:prepilin-type N-terminal cleavage/methylation domain-containing protein/prepilin-type processing-associated H-X9-DG protein